MITAALLTTARTQKQPRCPLTDEWIKKLWYVYTMEYYSAIKRNTFESVPMRWMNLEPIIQSEVSQKEKEKYRLLMHIYRIQKNGIEQFTYRHRDKLVKMGRGEERVRCIERVTWKLMLTKCKIDSQWEFAVWLRKLKQGLCINLEVWDGEGGSKGKGYIYTYG